MIEIACVLDRRTKTSQASRSGIFTCVLYKSDDSSLENDDSSLEMMIFWQDFKVDNSGTHWPGDFSCRTMWNSTENC